MNKSKNTLVQNEHVHSGEMYYYFNAAMYTDLLEQAEENGIVLEWFRGGNNDGIMAFLKGHNGERCVHVQLSNIWENWPHRIALTKMPKNDYSTMKCPRYCHWEEIGRLAASYINDPAASKKTDTALKNNAALSIV